MKRTLYILLLTFIAATAYPQISWNAKAGVNISNFTGDIDTETGIGYRFGVGMEYEFGYGFFVQPSLILSQRTIKAHSGVLQFLEDDPVPKGKINALYAELPVLLATRLWINDRFSLSVGIGPYFSYGIGGKVSMDGIDGEEDTFGSIYLKRFDWGFDSCFAIEYWMFFLQVESQLGLQDLSNGFYESDKSIKNSNIVISLGCRF